VSAELLVIGSTDRRWTSSPTARPFRRIASSTSVGFRARDVCARGGGWSACA